MCARSRGRVDREAGQSTVEWIGLLLVVTALLVGVLAAAGSGRLGATLVESIAMRLLCAVGMSSTCAESRDLVAAYAEDPGRSVNRAASSPELHDSAVATVRPASRCATWSSIREPSSEKISRPWRSRSSPSSSS